MKLLKANRLLATALLSFLLPAAALGEGFFSKYIGTSSTIFLPSELAQKLEDYNSFSAFWWNFIVVEPAAGVAMNETEAERICLEIKAILKNHVQLIQCGTDLAQFANYLYDWSKDLPNRITQPTPEAFLWKARQTLTKISILSGDKTLISFLRNDPLESYRDLVGRLQKKNIFRIERVGGYYIDRETARLVIPVQMNFPPTDVATTNQFYGELEKLKNVFFFGPHASNYDNQQQVITDVSYVSAVSTIVLVVFCLSLLLLRRMQLYILFPLVLSSVLLSAVMVVVFFGSIHSLTLSFGSAIIGLSLDYGLQSIFSRDFSADGKRHERRTWHANLFGLLTTLVVLIALAITPIPLMREMMIFSILGLVISFALIYLCYHLLPKYFCARPLPLTPSGGIRWGAMLAALLVMLAPISLFFVKSDFGLRQFNYQTNKKQDLQEWLFRSIEGKAPLFRINQNDIFNHDVTDDTEDERRWGEANGIELENLAQYIPAAATQKENVATWNGALCNLGGEELSPFRSYIKDVVCGNTREIIPSGRVPSYVKHLQAGSKWLTLWQPKTDEDVNKIKARYPDARSLIELASIFPEVLTRELWFKTPLSILLIIILLFICFKSVKYTVFSLIPFISGLGLFFFCAIMFGMTISFVSVVGLLMVCGQSVDFGIFVCGVLGRSNRRELSEGVWTGLFFSGLTTLLGYLPLVLCGHPVLRQLGQTLFLGTTGSLIATFWGVPGLVNYFSKVKNGEREWRLN